MKIPDDADGDAMRRVIEDGSDVGRPMDIDFMIACPDVAAAESIAPLAEAAGYGVSISVDEEDGAVTCYCVRRMLLDYDALMACQAELDEMGQKYGGWIDGWGTFGNGDG